MPGMLELTPRKQYDSSMCGKTIKITANGLTTTAKVMDLVRSLYNGASLWSNLMPFVVPRRGRKLQLWGYGYDSSPIQVLFGPKDRENPN
jgi:hypothetical protein